MAPVAQINIYPQGIIQTVKTKRGWASYPVSTEGLAQVFTRLPSASGLLPPGVLGVGTHHGVAFCVFYVPPRPATLLLAGVSGHTPHAIQTPPLVWAGFGHDYRIYALAEPGHPTSPQTALYLAPFPNVYDKSGGICWGSGERPPEAQPATMLQALMLFLEGSAFNQHLANNKSKAHPGNVMRAYEALTIETPYPLDDLVPAGVQLSQLLKVVDG